MEPLNLQKGTKLNLTKGNPGLSTFEIALGWDERVKASAAEEDFDPDVSVAVLHNSRPFENPKDLLFYNSNKDDAGEWIDKAHPYPMILAGALKSSGDERTGGKEGDDEVITADVSKFPADALHAAVIVTIYEWEVRKQNFGMMKNAYTRISAPGHDTVFPPQKADLTEDYSAYTAFIPGFFYRKDGDWKFDTLMKGLNNNTVIGKNPDGSNKLLGSTDLTTICKNLPALLEIAAAPVTA